MQALEEGNDRGIVHSEQNEGEDYNESVCEANEHSNDGCIATISTCGTDSVEKGNGLSKRKLKRLAKHEEWLKKKEQRKIERKERKRQAREQGAVFPSRSSRRKKQKTMDCEEALPLKIVIDLAYDKYMDNSCIKKLLKQVKACYAVNRKSPKPVQLYLTSFGGENKAIMEEVHHEYENWDMHIKSEAYTDLFDKDDIVYLSSESDNVLTDIDMNKTYIIGGLVDHNHHKGLCHRLAVENHVQHAQLPIKNFVELQSRTVLTVNHVFEIILKFVETQDWRIAFDMVIPKRKMVTLKQTTDEAPKMFVVEGKVEERDAH